MTPRSRRYIWSGVATVAAIAAAVGALVVVRRHGSDTWDQATTERLLLAFDPTPLGITPDGSHVLLQSRQADRFRLLLRPLAGGPDHVLDDSDRLQHSVTFHPGGRAIAFVISGDKPSTWAHAYTVSIDAPRRHEVLEASRITRLVWSPDGSRLALVVDVRSGRSLVTYDPVAQRTQSLVDQLPPSPAIGWSPDGARLGTATGVDGETLTLISVDGSQRETVVIPDGVRVRALDLLGDGQQIVYSGLDGTAESSSLYLLDAGGSHRRFETEPGDLTSPRRVPDGSAILATYRFDGEALLVRCPLETLRCGPVGPTSGTVAGTRFSANLRFFYFLHSGNHTPASVWRLELATGDSAPVFHGMGEARAIPISPTRVDLKSRDGLAIPVYVTRAPRSGAGGAAAVIRVHGGPATQWTRAWDPIRDLLLRAGLHVVDPNYRGSTGYGAAYVARGHDLLGQLDDLAATCRYVTTELGVRPDRIVMLANSYGALLTAAAMARTECADGALIMLSLGNVPSPPTTQRVPRTIRVFHGTEDPTSPAQARKMIELQFGRSALAKVDFRSLPDEGHAFARTSSWALVGAGLLETVPGLVPPHDPEP